ncbi:MAG TPA: class I SAM-dependent methyltransferase [Ohtaekwangia sp.]|uniref:class I SAM-dependent methyltransferase n=1 Tax=Ohtaekwangia sp. TaxID=2066019 RepID=UPI002F95983C
MNFSYGKTQYVASDRMKRSPFLSKMVYNVFGYTNVGNYARSRVFIRLVNSLPLSSFKKIIDLGAGLGEFTFMMAEEMPQTKFTAIEILPERVSTLKQVVTKFNFKNVEIFSDKIEKLPESAAYDFIFAVDVFEHIHKEDMPFKDCFEKLKPGGYLLVKIPNIKQTTLLPESLFEDHQEWLEHEHVGQVYDLNGLKQRFIDEGFTIEHSSNTDGMLSRIGWEIGFLSKKGGSAIQLLFLPLCKALVHLDRVFYFPRNTGNAIQVIGRKPA